MHFGVGLPSTRHAPGGHHEDDLGAAVNVPGAGYRLRELLGVMPASFRWERPALLVTALFVLDFCKWVGRALLDEQSGVPSWNALGSIVVATMSADLLVVLLAVVLVRYVANVFAAVAALAAVYPLAQGLLDWVLDGGGAPEPVFLAANFASNAVWVLAMFLALELAYRFTPRVWIAPLLAASLATFAALALRVLVIGPLAGLPTGDAATFTATGILGAVAFALTLTVGYRLAGWADVTLEERPRGFVSRSGYATALYSLLGIPLLVLLVALGLDVRPQPGDSVWLLIVAFSIPVVLWTICFLAFLYRIWSALPADQARTTPARAVALLFVPIFNLYWVFPAIVGFARDFNAVRARRNLPEPALPVALFAAYPVLTILTLVPVVGVWVTPLSFAALLAIVGRAADAANALR